MDLPLNVSLKSMMMDCPRCGFAQPQDRYCASCGLDIEHYHVKPTPLWIRLLQNPVLHLTLIGILIAVVIGYILYTRGNLVSREVGHLLGGSPLSSREAGDPDEVPAPETAAQSAALVTETADPGTDAIPAVTEAGTAPAAVAPVEVSKLEMGFFEIAHDALVAQMSGAEKIGETNEGRTYIFKDGGKIADSLRAAGRKLGAARSADLVAGASIVVATPPSTPEPFQFGLAMQLGKYEAHEASLRWNSQLVLSQPETAQEMASPNPAVKTVIEAALNGAAVLTPTNLLLIVIEPANRRPRDEYLNKAGEGPWSVFASEDYRAGVTDWVALVQLR